MEIFSVVLDTTNYNHKLHVYETRLLKNNLLKKIQDTEQNLTWWTVLFCILTSFSTLIIILP